MAESINDKIKGSDDLPLNKVDQILERMRTAAKVPSNKQLSEFLGLDPQATTSAKKIGKIPPLWFIKISERSGVSIDWLLYGRGPIQRGEGTAHDQAQFGCLSSEEYGIIPLLESWVVAGPEGEVVYDGIADYYPFKRVWLERIVGKSSERIRKLFLLKVRGDSMSPTINRGELVLVDTFEAERVQIRVGSVYVVVQPDGTTVLKRLAVSRDAGRVFLVCMSDNIAVYKPFEFEISPSKSILEHVIGRVRWAGKEFN